MRRSSRLRFGAAVAAAACVVLLAQAEESIQDPALPEGWGSGEIDGQTYYYRTSDPGTILWDPPDAAAEPAAGDAAAAAEPAAGGAETAEPAVLFTLQVNVTGEEAGGGGAVPLTLHEGESPAEVAEAFAKQHSLPELSKKELTVAILQYAKQNGFVSPAFSLPITLPPAAEGEAGESAVIPWYPGDSGAQLASEFAKQHGLGAEQRIQILRGLIKEAKGRGLVQPIFSLNVALPPFPGEDGEEPPPPKRVPLDVYDGDDLETVAAEFTARHSLPDAYQAQVRQGLRQRAKEQGLVRALFELGVTLLSGEREVLKVYEGDNIDQVAIDFAIQHDLGHDEREALVAAVEEQAQARKLVQPLLFKLPVKVGQPEDPWIAQLYVHQGDVPAQIATTFVNRYSGWGNATETAIQITKAILEKAQNVNQAVDEAASRVAGEEAQSKR